MNYTVELPRGYVGTPTNTEKRNLRILLKYPLGLLLPYPHPESTKLALKYLSKFNPEKVILVGDRVSYNFINEGFDPNTIIIDKREKRNEIDSSWINNWAKVIKHVKNPPGSISKASIETIKTCINTDKCAIVVDGEEDMLVLPTIFYYPETTIIFYGSPDVGLILVKSDKSKKRFVKKILEKVIRK
jgi:uncharacterized protein (UPF0218 family)